YRDAIEIRVSSSPAAAGSIGNLSDERIPDRVEHHGSRNNGADRRRRQPEQLVVEKQQQTEQLGLRAERDGAEAVGQPREEIALRPSVCLSRERGWAHAARSFCS